MAPALTEVERIQIREKTPALIMMHGQFCYRAADTILQNNLAEASVEIDALGLYLFDLALRQSKHRSTAYKEELKRRVIDVWTTQAQTAAVDGAQHSRSLVGVVFTKLMKTTGMGGRFLLQTIQERTKYYDECVVICRNSDDMKSCSPVEAVCFAWKQFLVTLARKHPTAIPVIDEKRMATLGEKFMRDLAEVL